MRRWMYALEAPALVGGLVVVAPLTSSAATFDVPSTDDDAADVQTLRGAVVAAHVNGEADTLALDGTNTYVLDVAGPGEDAAATGDLDITSDITIQGNGATIDASALGDRAFHVLAGGWLTLVDVTVTGGTATDSPSAEGGGSGGAVLNAGALSVDSSTQNSNSAVRAGGAIEASAGSTTRLVTTTLSDNSAGPTPGNGGGLHLTGAGTVTITGGTVSGNTAAAEGGGVWNSAAGTMSLTGVAVTGNTASGAEATQGGGGVFADAGSGVLTISGGSVSGNSADGAAGSGGGILNDQAVVVVDGADISDNTAVRAGGGIEANIGSTTLTGVDLSDNATGAAPGNGGGLHVTGAGEASVTDSSVTGNTAALEGGGLWNGSGTMTVTGTEISGNTASGAAADDGGGGLFDNGGTLVVSGSDIVDNAADGAAGSGGGILTLGGTLQVIDSALDGNTAVRAGGGIEATEGSSTTVTGGQIWQNTTGAAPGNGGALHLTGAGTVDITGTTVAENTAAAEGGGLWNSAAGTMTVTGATVRDNVASDADADSGGGGLYTDGGSLTVSDSIVSDNSADGAAGSGGGVLNVVASSSSPAATSRATSPCVQVAGSRPPWTAAPPRSPTSSSRATPAATTLATAAGST